MKLCNIFCFWERFTITLGMHQAWYRSREYRRSEGHCTPAQVIIHTEQLLCAMCRLNKTPVSCDQVSMKTCCSQQAAAQSGQLQKCICRLGTNKVLDTFVIKWLKFLHTCYMPNERFLGKNYILSYWENFEKMINICCCS